MELKLYLFYPKQHGDLYIVLVAGNEEEAISKCGLFAEYRKKYYDIIEHPLDKVIFLAND